MELEFAVLKQAGLNDVSRYIYIGDTCLTVCKKKTHPDHWVRFFMKLRFVL